MKNLIIELQKYKANGGTYSDLAKRINVSKSKLSKILHGERKPTTQELILLAKIFKCDVKYLIEE